MSSRLKKHLPLLKWLSEAKPKAAKPVLKVVDKQVLDTICECCVNVLRGNVPLTSGQKRKLFKYRQALRELAGPKKVSDKKRRVLVQRGGFLGSLLGPILGVLGHLLFK